MKSNIHGFLVAKGLDIECLGQCINIGCCWQYNNLLDKFPDDQIFLNEKEQVSFLDGYVYNKDTLIQNRFEDWQHAFAYEIKQDAQKCLRVLRGGFCGYQYDKNENSLIAFTDQVSIKSLYYYTDGVRWIISNNIVYMVEVFKANQLSYCWNEIAAQYMLTYGYMIDDSTFVKQIHRILPGEYIRIENGKVSVVRYHFIKDIETEMSEKEAIEKIDAAFREAVRREFEKDKEYGYRHLVDLSGGLDSRMVSWVAHAMGYVDQVNFTYSRTNYHDERISKQIAAYLKHEYLFRPLEDLKWMYDIENIVAQNNGAALYTGITGGGRTLALLRMDQFGIEHTGMLGDVIIGTYHDKETGLGKPVFGMNTHSDRLKYLFNEDILKEYPCQEMFCIYTRGILGMSSSYMIRQCFVETSSPFMDVDFMDTVFSLPFQYRYKHYIYLKWMQEKYPESTRFGWEKWGGIQPKESHIFFRKIKTTQRLLRQAACKMARIENRDNMNPIDYWYWRDDELQRYYKMYYDDNINNVVLGENLQKDISQMFDEGDITEKSMALTVLAAAKIYFN
ncbi:MAG: asparagine synthase-related protein [Clostridium sp.]|nr:asparagine synthase-related protein [Clostridium sp.]